MELLIIGLVGMLVVCVVRKLYTDFQYRDTFGIAPGHGTWKLRSYCINQALEILVEQRVDSLARRAKELEREAQNAEYGEDRKSIVKELNRTLRDLRDAKFAVSYACVIAERREGYLRARNLLGTQHQWLKPADLRH